MSEYKEKCSKCGKKISKHESLRYNGFCANCFEKKFPEEFHNEAGL